MLPLTINRLASGGVITNCHCVSQCGHCLYNCGPHRPQDYLIDILAATGIRGLFAMTRDRHGYTPRLEGYLNPCDLCTEIRRFLFRREKDRFAELAPSGFYA